jgi:hypothetical protein
VAQAGHVIGVGDSAHHHARDREGKELSRTTPVVFRQRAGVLVSDDMDDVIMQYIAPSAPRSQACPRSG